MKVVASVACLGSSNQFEFGHDTFLGMPKDGREWWATVVRRGPKHTLCALLVVLAIYNFPFLATSAALRSSTVPFSFAPDLSFYLNLSKPAAGTGVPVNPYFGTPTSPGQLGYFTFGLAFHLFGLLEWACGSNLWTALLAWNTLWWTALFVGAMWILTQITSRKHPQMKWFFLGLVLLWNSGTVKDLTLAWARLPSLQGFSGLSLPYTRVFFPQAPAVLLLFYLALQIRALEGGRRQDWGAMLLLQAIGLAMFPYVTLIMAAATMVGGIASAEKVPSRRTLVGYGVACAVIDAAFIWVQHSEAGTRQAPLLHVDLGLLPSLLGGAFALLAVMSALTAIVPTPRSPQAKWAVCGLGFGTCLLMLGDTIASPARLQLSQHAGYFYHTAAALQLAYLLSSLLEQLDSRPWIRTALIVATTITLLNGSLLTYATYRHSFPENAALNSIAGAVRRLNVGPGDLVVARATSVDDQCAWITVLTRGTTLFCRSAQYTLSEEEKHHLYRFRQAAYLYFSGKDTQWLEGVIADPRAADEQARLAFSGEIISSNQPDKLGAITSIRSELSPLLSAMTNPMPELETLFQAHPRVLVIDDGQSPMFSRERLLRSLSIDREQRVGELVVLWCRARDHS